MSKLDAVARAKMRMGRPRRLTPELERQILESYIELPSLTQKALALKHGVSRSTIHRTLRRAAKEEE